jgi:hypothetical protein
MSRPALKPTLVLFALGLGVGAAATGLLIRRAPDLAPADPSAASAPVALSAWAWRDSDAPPALAPDTVGPALAAWRGLRSPDGSPAPYPTRALALRALLIRLPAESFPRLLASLADAAPPDDTRLRQTAFDRWIELDAPAAARWAAAGKDLRGLARQAAAAWAVLDPQAAAAWACALPEPDTARDLAKITLKAFAEKDASAALALARSRDDDFRDAVLPSLLEPLAKADPAAALRAYGPGVWKDGQGFWQLQDTIADWSRRDPAAALAWLAAQPNGDRGNQLSHWISSLARTPEERRALATVLATTPSIPQRREALNSMIFNWGTEQPADALAWLNQLADPDLRLSLLERNGNSYFTDHPEKSLPLALALPASQNRGQSITRLLTAWAKIDPSATLAWIGAQNDSAVAAAAPAVQGVLLGTIARDEPATALAEWAALSDPRAKKAAIQPIAEAWGQTDPAAALQWAVAQPDSPGRVHAHSELIAAWAKKDPEAALRWAEAAALKENAQGNRYYPSPLSFIGGDWNDKAPRAQTADLYTKIQDPALRLETITNHVREWRAQDPAAARTWLETQTALTPEQTAALLSPPPRK